MELSKGRKLGAESAGVTLNEAGTPGLCMCAYSF